MAVASEEEAVEAAASSKPHHFCNHTKCQIGNMAVPLHRTPVPPRGAVVLRGCYDAGMTRNQGYSYRHCISPKWAGRSLLDYLSIEFDHSSREEWNCRVAGGEIVVNERIVSFEQHLQAGDLVVWNRPPWDEEDVPRDFTVIYEDQWLLAVDKPSGLPTLPGAGFLQNTLLSIVQEQFPEAYSLHRLGRATSGLVLFARDRQTASVIQSHWSQIHKQYQALASGITALDHYDIYVPIGPVPHPRLGSVHAASISGKPARSVARVLERRVDSTLCEVDLITGRPHQIRIHLASIGHPLVGDPLYAPGGIPRDDNPGLPGDAGYSLHAKRLEFTHPVTKQHIILHSPLPKILERQHPVTLPE